MLVLLSLSALSAAGPELRNVKSVYLLPMANGFDQYLANQLQASNLYVVVANPQAADAVITSAIGPAFERKMDELYVEKADEEEGDLKGNDSVPRGNFRRGQGMVFIVERKSRQVVWSAYEPSKDARSGSLDQAARRVTERLKKELNGQTPSK